MMQTSSAKRREKMAITLENTYLNSEARKEKLKKELEILEEKLKTPERTLEDIVRHMQILLELKKLN